MAELVDGTVATGAAAFHAGTPENAATPSGHTQSKSPSEVIQLPSVLNHPALLLQSSHEDLNSPPRAPHMCQPTGTPHRPLQDHTNTPKHAYDNEITGDLSDDDSEQVSSSSFLDFTLN